MEYQAYEAVLAKLHNVSADDMPAFYARLRQIRNAGIPKVTNPGKGQRRIFTELDLWETHLALTLIEAGLPPHRVTIAFDKWIRPFNAFQKVCGTDTDTFLVLMSYLNIAKGSDIDLIHSGADLVSLDDLTKHFRTLKRPRAEIVLNLTKLTKELF